VPEPDSGYLAADDGCLHWAVAGAGPVVVAIHGGSADLRMWESLVPALAESYRVIRYDLRGLGRSEPPAAPYRMAGDVAAVLDHLGEASAALVGFSTGGAIAAEFTVRRDHPETADLCSTRWRLASTGSRAYSAGATPVVAWPVWSLTVASVGPPRESWRAASRRVHAHEPVAARRGSAVCAAFTMGGT
jgi:pimeloyl-ACP methyl ester carboxylesterase